MEKNYTKLMIGIFLILINIIFVLKDYSSCLSIPDEFRYNITCSLTGLNYGILYFLGRFLILIIGIMFIIFWIKSPYLNNYKYTKNETTFSEESEDDYFIEEE